MDETLAISSTAARSRRLLTSLTALASLVVLAGSAVSGFAQTRNPAPRVTTPPVPIYVMPPGFGPGKYSVDTWYGPGVAPAPRWERDVEPARPVDVPRRGRRTRGAARPLAGPPRTLPPLPPDEIVVQPFPLQMKSVPVAPRAFATDGPLLLQPGDVVPASGQTVVTNRATSAAPITGDTLVLALSQPFLERQLKQSPPRIEPVEDVIAGADVVGEQTTTRTVRLALVPRDDQAELTLLLTGAVASETVAVTPQASISSVGRHTFSGTKPVYFDGCLLRTLAPKVSVTVSNENIGADTTMSGVPLLAGIAQRIAMRKAAQRGEQVDREVAEKISAKTSREFNSEADRELSAVNESLTTQMQPWLAEQGLAPAAMHARTTTTHMEWSWRWTGEADPAVAAPPLVYSARGLSLAIHESALNQMLTNDALADSRWEESDLLGLLPDIVAMIGARVEGNWPPARAAYSPVVHFAKEKPLSISLRDGELILTARASFEVAGQSVVEPQSIEVAYEIENSSEGLRILRKGVSVKAEKPPKGFGAFGLTDNLVKPRVEAGLPSLRLSEEPKFPAGWPSAGGLRVRSIEFKPEWLVVVIE